MTTHQIDPNEIKVGQWAHFKCPEEDCTYQFWKKWQPAAAVSMFGDYHCFMHGKYPGPIMYILEVNDDGPPGFDPTRKTGFEHHRREDGPTENQDSSTQLPPGPKEEPRSDGRRRRRRRKKGAR